MMNLHINNLPAYAAKYHYIVFVLSRGVAWFYGAWNDADAAASAAAEVGGGVAENPAA